MAKTRSRSRKSGASTRAKGTKKKAVKRKTAARRAKPAARPEGLDLKRLRREIDMAVSALARRVVTRAAQQPSANLDQAQTTLSRWAAEIDNLCDPNERAICGPSMVIPLA